MNIQAKLYYPSLIGFSLISMLILSIVAANFTLCMSLMIGLFVLCLYGVSIGELSFSYISSLGKFLKYGVGVVSIVLPIALYIKAAEALVGIQAFELQELLNFQISSFYILLPISLCFYAIFALNIFIYRSFIADLNANYRIAFVTTSTCLIYLGLYYSIGFHIGPIPFILGAASYFFLMDLFIDRYSPSIIWTVLWNVMLCAYISLILFSAHNALLISGGGEVLPILDGLSFFSICFVFSSAILFLFSRMAEASVFENSYTFSSSKKENYFKTESNIPS